MVRRPIFRKLVWVGIIPALLALLIAQGNATSPSRMIAAICVAAGLSVILSYWFSRSLNRQVARLRQSLGDLHELGLSESNPAETDNDLGALASSVDRISEQLHLLVSGLREESRRGAAILSSMVEGVVTVDRDLRVTFCNASFRRLVGMTEMHRPVRLVETVRNPEIAEMLKAVLESRQPLTSRIQLAGVDVRIFDAHATLIEGVSQPGAILILHDITELERLERVRKDFVANVSHELRTPLTAICGYAEALLDGALDDAQHNRRFVEIIENHAQRLNRIASDLLVLSELESARPRAAPEWISVRDALTSALKAIESEAGQRQVQLICEGIDEAEVVGYRVHFEQAVLNLLQNAVKFNRPGGEVRVRAARNGSKICISIVDTGIGIPSEDLPRVFERFYRVDRAHSREVGGTGLGLSIVKHAIERMNGTVEVESRLGIGSEFRITVPVASD